MAAPQRNPAGRYPDGRGRPPGARTQAPPFPPPQGLWPGHPSGPLPQAPPVWPQPPAGWPPTGRTQSGRPPSGPLPRRQTGPLPAAPGPVRRYPPPVPGDTLPVRTTAQLRRDTLERTTAQLRSATAVRPARRLPPPATAKGKPLVPGRGTARAVLPGIVLAVIGLGAAAVIALWWQDNPRISGTGNLLTAAGQVLGLLAGYGFVVLVGLMARLPPLERRIGSDRLARWHAAGGKYVITLVTGHVLFIVWGYAVIAHEKVTRMSITLLTSYPDVLMATVAWFLLLGIGFSSARAARRRLSYETWYYAHLYTYLAIALAFSHQFADGADFDANAKARIAWSALYATVGALIVWYRILTPLRRAARHRFTVQHVRPEGPGIVSVFVAGRDFDRLRAEPGQFFRWRFLTRELWWQSHPYSLSAMPQPDLMRITVKARGEHSDAMASLAPGTRIIAEGPYGAFTPALSGRRVLLIAGGVGITPIRAMFAALPSRMSDGITLLYRASHPRDVVFSRELDAIAADRNATLHYLIGARDRLGYDPLSADCLQRLVPGLHRYEAYVCGPPGMTEAAVRSLRAAGIPRRRIHHESFAF